MLVTKQIEIDMGHRVPNHKSKCRNLHGHRYKIEVGVDDKVINKKGASDEGMVIDFGDLKEILMEKIDSTYDHSFTVCISDDFYDFFEEIEATQGQKVNFTDFIPTAENLAEAWYHEIKEPLKERGIKIKYLKVWETPTSTATYEE